MSKRSHRATLTALVAALTGIVAAALLLPAAAGAEPKLVPAPAIPGVSALPGPVAKIGTQAPQGLSLLKTAPENGKVGAKFTVSGSGLPANKDVDILWSTAQGGYLLDASSENLQYYGKQLDPIFVTLGHGTTDAQGNLKVGLTVPRDFGNLHDIYAVSNGVQLAKGGFLVNRTASIAPAEGPIGTPITVKIGALGWLPYESSVAVLYDNRYVGYASSTTTRGELTFQIRATGSVGTHVIELDPASHAVPFLDVDQSATWYNRQFRFTFKVTGDNGAPANVVEWPLNVAPTIAAKTTLTGTAAAGVSASLSRQSGPVLTKVQLTAKGLSAGAVDLQWVTAVGTRAKASGWALQSDSISKAAASADGTLSTTVTIPDNLGGWHAVQLVQNGKLQAEVPFYVTQSLLAVTPAKVQAGDIVHVHVKGVGWTEFDNGFAVTYDNSFVGYACGFYSRGDVDLKLVATGSPGTHLIDIYPMIYKGKANDLWNNELPMLTFARDNPALAGGYRLPAYHLAVEITE